MTNITTHLSNPFHPYTEQELADAFDNNAQGGNPFGVKISAYNKMPKVKEAILLNVKKGLEDAGVASRMAAANTLAVKNAHGRRGPQRLPGAPETIGTTSDNFENTATLKNPNPPTPHFRVASGAKNEWTNEYYIFHWNDDAPAMKVERFIDSERAAANIVPLDEARKLWATLASQGFERTE